ncbi:MAG: hypothetical protein KatS3mg129_2342 [Leptospiraceae bacterium]|nr:MAG: hypothetical protein KatS3mg129_2342 [Leptospiraceae bacterium]
MPEHKFTLKYDEFFKIVTKNFFELLNCNVITEYEILNLPKKADIIIIKNPDTKKLELFKYFKLFNIISFKSEKDKPSIKDFNDLFIYLTGFCNREKSANLNNTTITLITPDFTKSFKNLLNKHAILLQDGLYKFHNDLLNIYFIEINQLDIHNYEIEYLYIFANQNKLKEGLKNIKLIPIKDKKMIALLQEMYYVRYSNFEKQLPEGIKMPKVYEADITDLVKPHYEKGLQEGLQKGKQEGLQEGLQKGKIEGLQEGELKTKIETAKKMLKKGYSIQDICDITGLSKKELKKYKIIN